MILIQLWTKTVWFEENSGIEWFLCNGKSVIVVNIAVYEIIVNNYHLLMIMVLIVMSVIDSYGIVTVANEDHNCSDVANHKDENKLL